MSKPKAKPSVAGVDYDVLVQAAAEQVIATATAQYGELLLRINAMNDLSGQFNGRQIQIYCLMRMAYLIEQTTWNTPQEEIAQLEKLSAMGARLTATSKRMNPDMPRDTLADIRNNHPPLERTVPTGKA